MAGVAGVEGAAERPCLGGLGALEAALLSFRQRPRGERPAGLVRDELVGLRGLIDRMELEFSAGVSELAGCDQEEWLGHPSPTAWVTAACKTSGPTAWSALVVGEQSARLPETVAALEGGQIGLRPPQGVTFTPAGPERLGHKFEHSLVFPGWKDEMGSGQLVGAPRFEPGTSCSQSKCARLSSLT